MERKNDIEIYRTDDGQTQIELIFEDESFWLPLQQISKIWRNPFGLPPDRTGGLAVRSPFRDFAHQKVLQNVKHFPKTPGRCNELKQIPQMKTKISIMFLFLSPICFGQTLPKINSLIEKQ